jgi:hypothetical protein
VAKWQRPRAGQVIQYVYNWHRDFEAGDEEGAKSRPCVVAFVDEEKGILWVLPVTRTPPSDPSAAVEIPPKLKEHLGLDHNRSWIIISEANFFTWPGPDIRRAPGQDTPIYGWIHPRFSKMIRDLIEARAAAGKPLQPVPRTE